ncbi:MAG: hypothetical protein IT328_04490 [Caldilineaceae bacterium]|nr:hypothetical protein [Caldilineaceae bacterium]
MRDLLFGQGAVVMWSFAAAVFGALAAHMWLIVWEVGGIRGTSMGILFSGCAITAAGFAAILSHSPMLPGYVMGAIISAVWPPMLLASFILADIYAAERNSHRALITKIYLWFKRESEQNRQDAS